MMIEGERLGVVVGRTREAWLVDAGDALVTAPRVWPARQSE